MISDAIQLLRALAPEPAGTAPPIDRLWRRLEADGMLPLDDVAPDISAQASSRDWTGGSARAGRSLRGSGFAARFLVAGLLGVALAIGIGAVVALHSSHPPGGGAPATRQALPSPERGLAGILGVLRRPQTPADRDLGPSLTSIVHHSRVGTPVMSLVRIAGLTPDGQKIVLVPMRPSHGTWPPGPGGRGSSLRLGLFAGGAGCCVTPEAIEAGRAWSSAGRSSGNYVVLVVPDRVTRVRVALPHPVMAPVHENVAVFAVPQAVENLKVYPMTWFGPSGQVVARFRSSLSAAPTPG